MEMQGDLLYIPRGWSYSCSSARQFARFLLLVADSERFSHAHFAKILFATLGKSVDADAKLPDDSPKRTTSIFTQTQKDALQQQLIPKFIDKIAEEADQEWIRQSLPLGYARCFKNVRAVYFHCAPGLQCWVT